MQSVYDEQMIAAQKKSHFKTAHFISFIYCEERSTNTLYKQAKHLTDIQLVV